MSSIADVCRSFRSRTTIILSKDVHTWLQLTVGLLFAIDDVGRECTCIPSWHSTSNQGTRMLPKQSAWRSKSAGLAKLPSTSGMRSVGRSMM